MWIYVMINVFVFLIFGLDKQKAIKGRYRISEKVLLFFALIGPMGAWIGMRFFRHKTKKPVFHYSILFFLICHLALFVYFYGTIQQLNF